MAEIRQARERELDIQAERHDRVDAGDHGDERPERGVQEIHDQRTRALPNNPCGRQSRSAISAAKASTGFMRASRPPARPLHVESSITMPSTTPATRAPYALPIPPSTTDVRIRNRIW